MADGKQLALNPSIIIEYQYHIFGFKPQRPAFCYWRIIASSDQSLVFPLGSHSLKFPI